MLFGSKTDFNLLRKINRELLQEIVEQEILIHKYAVEETQSNIYGEALNKVFNTPVKVNCLITRGDQVVKIDEFGTDLMREASFAILRNDLEDINLVVEKGDIIEWHEDFYEVDNIRENQLFLGRDNSYNLTSYGGRFGKSISIICDTHLTRGDKLGIKRLR